MIRQIFLIGTLTVALAATTVRLSADVFLLKEGGSISGEHLNSGETPRKTWHIGAADGMELRIESKHVDRSRKGEREALIEYNAFAPFMEDTIDNHLEIADWCSKNQLPDLARLHRMQVLEHDPDHKLARQTLGYYKDKEGRWTTQEEQLGQKGGLIRHKNSWKSRQQIEVEQLLEERKKKEVAWTNRIDRLRESLPRGEKARADLLAIKDPEAVPALWNALGNERNEDTRILIIKALGSIGTASALQAIAQWSLNVGEHFELRKTCFEELKKYPEAKQMLVGFYVSELGRVDRPDIINAAALGIGELDGKTAIPQLIDALITVYKYKEKQKAPATTFGNMGNVQGMNHAWGETVVERTKPSENREVRAALMKLTGMDFQFNKDAWRNWVIQQRRTSSFNARRG